MKALVPCLAALILACAVAGGLPSSGLAASAQQGSLVAREREEQGDHELKIKNWTGAAKEFRTALALDPASVAAHIGLGIALQETGDAVGAVSQFQKAIQLDPRNAAAHYHLAVALGREGNPNAAKAELVETLKLKPDSADAHYTLGLLLVDWPYTKDFTGAAKQFEAALKYKPDFPEAHEELGEVFLTLGKGEAALAQFREAVKLRPAFPEAYCGIGRALGRNGDLQGASQAYRAALRLRPNDAETHNQLGLVLIREKKLDEAIAEFHKAIKLRPGDDQSYYDLGRALSLKGRRQAAEVEFQKAKDLWQRHVENSGQATQLNDAGVALMQRRKFAQAEAKLRSALDINPTYGTALYNLGLVLASQGEFNSAITEFRKALVEEPINPKIHFDLARALELDGNLPGAVDEFQIALRLRPGYRQAQEALKQTLQRQGRLRPSETRARKELRATGAGDASVKGLAGAATAGNPATPYPSLETCENVETASEGFHRPLPASALRLAAVCAFRLNDFQNAIPLLTRAAKLNPHDENLPILLARAYSKAGQSQAAIDTLKAWAKAHGEDVDALYWTGKFYDELANRSFQQMAAKYPKNYLVYETEGNQLAIKEQYSQALASYEKALALAPKGTPGLHFHVGDIYWRTLRYGKAEDELEQELKINPYHAKANYELGAIYAKEGNPQKAVTYLDKAIALDPSLIAAHRSLGQAYLDQRQYDQALAQLLIVAKAKPSDYTVRNMLSTTYRMLGRLADARREAAESQKLYAQHLHNFQAIQSGEQKLPQ